MEDQVFKSAVRSAMAFALVLFVTSCGGKQTVASRSAEAFREAQQKGTPMGGDSHGGHSAGESTDSSSMKSGDMAGMDHSKMKSGDVAGMDHSRMKSGDMAGMDHSKMKSSDMAGMDHSRMKSSDMAGMDHSKMKSGDMAGMDHGSMPGMQPGASEPATMKVPATNSEMKRVSPATTLATDDFDAPSPVSVAESTKTVQSGGHEGHQMASPVSATPPAPVMDHSQHGQPPAAAKPRPQPSPKRTVRPRPKSAAAAVYTCPMHPEVKGDKPGKCPKCGMALVKKQ